MLNLCPRWRGLGWPGPSVQYQALSYLDNPFLVAADGHTVVAKARQLEQELQEGWDLRLKEVSKECLALPAVAADAPPDWPLRNVLGCLGHQFDVTGSSAACWGRVRRLALHVGLREAAARRWAKVPADVAAPAVLRLSLA